MFPVTQPTQAAPAPAAPVDPHINPSTGVWDDNFYAQHQQATAGMNPNSLTPLSGTPNLAAISTPFDAQIQDIQGQINKSRQAQTNTMGFINENPFYSESLRTGKLSNMFDVSNRQIGLLQDQLSLAQTNRQQHLDVATKQFDINSQAKTQALSQFNTLLQSGALANAKGSDIARIAQTTGLSPDMVQSAVSRQGVSIEKLGPDNQGNYTFVSTKNGKIIGTQQVAGGTIAKPTVVHFDQTTGKEVVQYPDGHQEVIDSTKMGYTPQPTMINGQAYVNNGNGQLVPAQPQGLLDRIHAALFGPAPINLGGSQTPTSGASATPSIRPQALATLQQLSGLGPKANASAAAQPKIKAKSGVSQSVANLPLTL